MSELKRWDANRVSKEPAMLCHEYGPYVLIEDYVKLKTENERLRDAGDDLYLICLLLAKDKSEPARKAWYNSKKEGRDAK